jgi:alanine-synthesizing transaminase
VQDVRLKPYELFYDHGWHLDLRSLERQLTPRTRAVMVVSPNNPTGSYLDGSEAEALQQFCAEHDLAVVADEVFWDYALDSAPHTSWASRSEALTFTLGGLSKAAGLPQFKLAWTVVNGPDGVLSHALQRLEIIADTYLSVNAPIQHALPELLATASGFQAQVRDRCRTNLGHLQQSVAASDLLRVDAGWYAVVRIPAVVSDEEFAVQLLEREGVLVHPGHFYNFTKEGYIVLSLLPPHPMFAEANGRLLRAMEVLL